MIKPMMIGLFLYLLVFCRVVLGLVFALSAIWKVRDISQFVQAIRRFRIVPVQLTTIAALLFLGCEFAVTLFMVAGGMLLSYGFGLALLLLLFFSLALGSALVRRIRTSCNCFGATTKIVSPIELWRNTALILCAGGGLGALTVLRGEQPGLTLAETGLIGLAALLFVAVWLQLGEIVQLFRPG